MNNLCPILVIIWLRNISYIVYIFHYVMKMKIRRWRCENRTFDIILGSWDSGPDI